MTFLNKQDFLSLIDQNTLNLLTENNNQLLSEAEARAIEEMTGYLNTRYDTSQIFNKNKTKNSLIVMYLCDIVLCHLHARISPDNIPELRQKRYENAKEWLQNAADGFISPLLPHQKNKDNIPIRYGNSLKKQKHYY